MLLVGLKLAAVNSNTAVQQRGVSAGYGVHTRAEQEAADETAVSISILLLLPLNAQLGHDQCKPEPGLTGSSDPTSTCWFL